jgi:hypothetical protein
MMKRSISFFAAGCVLSQIGPAWAAPVDYGSLPEGSVGAAPKLADAPKSVPWRGAVPGFFLASDAGPRHKSTKRAYALFRLSANKADADRMKEGAQPREDISELTSCFETLPVSSLENASGREWAGVGESAASMTLQKQDTANSTGIYAAHVERWVESAEGVALETSDAWIDLQTRGVRVYRNSRLPLVKVAEPYAGVTVYAGRTERAVEFVVRIHPKDNEQGGQLVAELGPSVVIAKDNEATNNSCGFARIGLDGDPGEGHAATVSTDVPIAFDLGDAGKSAPTPGPEATNPPMREITLRALTFSFSVSRLSADLQPVVAMSYGFAGEERRLSL